MYVNEVKRSICMGKMGKTYSNGIEKLRCINAQDGGNTLRTERGKKVKGCCTGPGSTKQNDHCLEVSAEH